MTVEPTNSIAASGAGSHLAESSAAGSRRARHLADHERMAAAQLAAQRAAGIGAADSQDLAAHDRDADGRRPWQLPAQQEQGAPAKNADGSPARGSQIDVTG